MWQRAHCAKGWSRGESTWVVVGPPVQLGDGHELVYVTNEWCEHIDRPFCVVASKTELGTEFSDYVPNSGDWCTRGDCAIGARLTDAQSQRLLDVLAEAGGAPMSRFDAGK